MQLTKQDLIDANVRAGTGVTKVTPLGSNAHGSAQDALLTQLNHILKAKEAK